MGRLADKAWSRSASAIASPLTVATTVDAGGVGCVNPFPDSKINNAKMEKQSERIPRLRMSVLECVVYDPAI
jgi:hypothetical protein